MDYLLPLICMLVGIAGVIFSIVIAGIVRKAPAGNEKMAEIALAIKTGAIAYLNRQLKSMGHRLFNRSDCLFCGRICRNAGVGVGQCADG
jgi:Na+/H+-translocating membrane pyrophosphatase